MSNVSRVSPEIAAQIAFRQSDRQIFSFERDHYYHGVIENATTKFPIIFKKISISPNRPHTLHAHGNAFLPGRVPSLGVSGTLEAAGGAFSTHRPSPRCFGVFVCIILLILPILTVVQVLRPCTGGGIFSRNRRFRADKTMCVALRGHLY